MVMFPMNAGCYSWEGGTNDQVRVRLDFQPGYKLDVDVWWKSKDATPCMRLWVPLQHQSARFGDLTGNGYGSKLHRQGFGTFAVNLAVQVLQKTYEPDAPVSGILSNPSDPTDQKARLEHARRMFWSQFGLTVSSGHYEQLAGTVGGLRCVHEGLVAGQFSRYLDLCNFSACK